jgi:hypothetical protein
MGETEYFKCKCGHDGFYMSNHEVPTKRLMMCSKCAEVHDQCGNHVEIEPIRKGETVTFRQLKVKE